MNEKSREVRSQGAIVRTFQGERVWLHGRWYELPPELDSAKAFRLHWFKGGEPPPEIEWEGGRVQLKLWKSAESDAQAVRVEDIGSLPVTIVKIRQDDCSVLLCDRHYALPKECATDWSVKVYLPREGPPLVETLDGVRPLLELV